MGNPGTAPVTSSAVDQLTRGVQRALLWIRPDGGQGRARRNAWSSMVRDGQRRAQRLEAEQSALAAQSASAAQHHRPVAAVGG